MSMLAVGGTRLLRLQPCPCYDKAEAYQQLLSAHRSTGEQVESPGRPGQNQHGQRRTASDHRTAELDQKIRVTDGGASWPPREAAVKARNTPRISFGSEVLRSLRQIPISCWKFAGVVQWTPGSFSRITRIWREWRFSRRARPIMEGKRNLNIIGILGTD